MCSIKGAFVGKKEFWRYEIHRQHSISVTCVLFARRPTGCSLSNITLRKSLYATHASVSCISSCKPLFFPYFSSFSVLARFLSHFTWTFWLRASDDWSRPRDKTTREAYGILNTAPELIGKICPFFMYICIILLSLQKQITVK